MWMAPSFSRGGMIVPSHRSGPCIPRPG
jgi:hypothetical protein